MCSSISTLSAAIVTATGGAVTISVASAVGFPLIDSYLIQIDSEIMLVTSGLGTTSWDVARGVAGTTPAVHSAGAAVDFNRIRVMSPGEAALLRGNGTNKWSKYAGRSLAMTATLVPTVRFS